MGKRQPKQLEINAAWTSGTVVHGWRHFRVCGRRQTESGLELELMAVCDRAVRFWVPAAELQAEDRWRSGWAEL